MNPDCTHRRWNIFRLQHVGKGKFRLAEQPSRTCELVADDDNSAGKGIQRHVTSVYAS